MPPKQLIKCKLDKHVRAAGSAHDLRNVQRPKNYRNLSKGKERAQPNGQLSCWWAKEPKADMAKRRQTKAKPKKQPSLA